MSQLEKKKTVLGTKVIADSELVLSFSLYKKGDYVSGNCKWETDGEKYSDTRVFGKVGDSNVEESIAKWISDISDQVDVPISVEQWDTGDDMKPLNKVLPAPKLNLARMVDEVARQFTTRNIVGPPEPEEGDEEYLRVAYGDDNLKVVIEAENGEFEVEVYKLEDGVWNSIEEYYFGTYDEAEAKFEEILAEF